MPNRSYEKGRRAEYRVKAYLENLGYWVTRSAGSHGVDLVAIRKGWVTLLVSVKAGKARETLKEREALKEVRERTGAVVRLARVDPILSFASLDDPKKTKQVAISRSQNATTELRLTQ